MEGVDYNNTFTPVIKPVSIRLILTLVVTHDWPLQQLDIGNTFLNNVLEETILMLQPQGFVDSDHPHHV